MTMYLSYDKDMNDVLRKGNLALNGIKRCSDCPKNTWTFYEKGQFSAAAKVGKPPLA